ncbi:MAG: 16S rRNA (guanine(966)-N(2))-methyltransferase RsmD [Syntrophales bacterium]
MRISGGEAKGRLIRIPAGGHVRPTTDRVRESLFNILSTVAETSFLDLFAGSGIVGMEALSRGAAHAVFVEKDLKVADALRERISGFGFTGRANVISAPVHKALDILRRSGKRFDIIFADPPYNEGQAVETMHFLGNGELIAPAGVLVLQHSAREKTGELKAVSLFLTDKRQYGETVLSFFRKEDSGGEGRQGAQAGD